MRVLSLAIFIAVANPAVADRVTVFAAASLAPALDQVGAAWGDQTGHEVVISYAGSGALAFQILNGAPADIFISASTEWMAAVMEGSPSAVSPSVDLLGNTLVLVSATPISSMDVGPDLDLLALLGDGRLAMGLVDSVPAGQYGKAALETLGLWTGVADQVAQVDNVRAALALVARGEAPLGIVYGTDAAAEPGVHLVGTFPAASHPAITYPAVLLSDRPEAAAFFADLQSAAAGQVFAAQGFLLPERSE